MASLDQNLSQQKPHQSEFFIHLLGNHPGSWCWGDGCLDGKGQESLKWCYPKSVRGAGIRVLGLTSFRASWQLPQTGQTSHSPPLLPLQTAQLLMTSLPQHGSEEGALPAWRKQPFPKVGFEWKNSTVFWFINFSPHILIFFITPLCMESERGGEKKKRSWNLFAKLF